MDKLQFLLPKEKEREREKKQKEGEREIEREKKRFKSILISHFISCLPKLKSLFLIIF